MLVITVGLLVMVFALIWLYVKVLISIEELREEITDQREMIGGIVNKIRGLEKYLGIFWKTHTDEDLPRYEKIKYVSLRNEVKNG